MKVRLLLEVGDYERFVIAKFFSPAAVAGTADRTRLRATRAQVRKFVRGALRLTVRDHAQELRSMKARATAKRLEAGAVPEEMLPAPKEQQRSLVW